MIASRRKYGVAEGEEIFPKSRGGSGISSHSSRIFRSFRPVGPHCSSPHECEPQFLALGLQRELMMLDTANAGQNAWT